jgi:hypothetical protein
MQVPINQLKPLSNVQLSADESKMLEWLRSAAWEPQNDARDPIPYKAKLPEFFGGVRLYNMQGGAGASGAHGALSLFIKKLEYQGVISKQELYPVVTQGSARFLSLKKADLDNLGVGQEEDEED